MTYIVDIDGTICNPGSIEEKKYTDATPILSRIEQINKIYDEGHQIIYLTARGMGRFDNNSYLAEKMFYELTANQLIEWGCKHHKLIFGKPSGDFYIDDKGINSDDFFKN